MFKTSSMLVIRNSDSELPDLRAKKLRLEYLERKIQRSKKAVARSFLEVGKHLCMIDDEELLDQYKFPDGIREYSRIKFGFEKTATYDYMRVWRLFGRWAADKQIQKNCINVGWTILRELANNHDKHKDHKITLDYLEICLNENLTVKSLQKLISRRENPFAFGDESEMRAYFHQRLPAIQMLTGLGLSKRSEEVKLADKKKMDEICNISGDLDSQAIIEYQLGKFDEDHFGRGVRYVSSNLNNSSLKYIIFVAEEYEEVHKVMFERFLRGFKSDGIRIIALKIETGKRRVISKFF